MKTQTVFIASIVTALALITGYSFAGGMGKMGGGMMGQGGMNYIFDELSITEDQQSQINTIMQDFREEMRATMAGRTEPPTEQERNAHHDLLQYRLASVLSDDQLEGLEKYMDAHGQNRGGGHHGQGGYGNCDQEGNGHMNGNGHMKGNGHMNGMNYGNNS